MGSTGLIETALVCLSLNIYFEARNQPTEGQIAVSQVVLNRVKDSKFPDNICSVIKQGIHSKISGIPLRWKCQFSWYCDGKTDIPKDIDAYRWANVVASYVLSGEAKDLVMGATYYHSTCVSPNWNIKKTRTAKIGDHIFYKREK
jgi:N-acetylmuramoyl-L-alanine amidase